MKKVSWQARKLSHSPVFTPWSLTFCKGIVSPSAKYLWILGGPEDPPPARLHAHLQAGAAQEWLGQGEAVLTRSSHTSPALTEPPAAERGTRSPARSSRHWGHSWEAAPLDLRGPPRYHKRHPGTREVTQRSRTARDVRTRSPVCHTLTSSLGPGASPP